MSIFDMFDWIKSLTQRKTAEKPNVSRDSFVDCDELMRQGFVFQESGNIIEAKKIYETILEHQATYTDALYFLGIIHDIQGDKKRAIELIEAAIATNRNVADFYKALGHLYSSQKNPQKAAIAFENALSLEKVDVTTITSLANSYRELGAFGKSLDLYSKAIDIAPNCWPAINTRAEVHLHCGHVIQALDDYKKAYSVKPDEAPAFRCYLFALNFATHLSALEIFKEHRRYDTYFGQGKYGEKTRNIQDKRPDRILRVGYVSPDLHFHAVSFFIEPILEKHNREQVEVFCYHIDNLKDDTTKKLMSLSDHWRDCFELSSEAISEQIITDKIDILIDLAGHTSNNRLEIFALKPAPIQITWLGYINTTGLSSMDYRIVDPYSDPVGVSEQFHSEKLLRMPNTQWCFKKPSQEIEVSSLPALSNGYITFGSFNRFSKLSSKILNLWADLMNALPTSHLILIDVPDCELDQISEFFINKNIDIKRLEFYGRIAQSFYRELHQKVDIALDAHPYSGGTTTCESLWMGVPVLTLTGETSVSRSTASLLINLGLNDWISRSESEFIETSLEKARNFETLGKLRENLRGMIENSPIMDSDQFTKDLEKAYRDIWIKQVSNSN